MAQEFGSLVPLKKRKQTNTYVVNFSTNGKTTIDIRVPFNIGMVEIDAPVVQQEYKANVAGACTPVWAVYCSHIDTDSPIAHYVPIQYGFAINIDYGSHKAYYDIPKKIYGLVDIYQAKGNSWVYDGSVPDFTTAANNVVLLRMTFHEY